MKSEKLLALLQENGFNFFCGVPCSYLSSFIALLPNQDIRYHFPAVREDLALGLAVGAALGGKKPVLYMQNSGLGYSLESFASLPLIYRIPLLVLLSHRGPNDQGWEEHRIMGENTQGLLQTFQLKFSILKETFGQKEMSQIVHGMEKFQQPYFLLIGRGDLT